MKLEKRIAVITGAGRGIGESIAHAFADEGADLILTARTRRQLDRVADDIKAKNRNAAGITCDVSSPTEVEKLAAKVKGKFGRVDILVNNAGISRIKSSAAVCSNVFWNPMKLPPWWFIWHPMMPAALPARHLIYAVGEFFTKSSIFNLQYSIKGN